MTHSSPENAEPEIAVARAIVHIRELFQSAPFLAASETPIGGCGLVSFSDLKAIQEYADQQFEAYNDKIDDRAATLIRAQPAASPETAEPQGHTEAEGYTASLRQQADLMEKANAGKVSAYVAIDDFDVDELRDAADFIERIITQPTAPPENAGWTPDQFWEYVGGLAGEFEAGQMRDMMMSHGLSLGISAQRMPEPVVWQYRVLHDKGHIFENVWCEWHQTSQSYYEKCCAEIASGNTRLQVRPLYAFTSPGRGQPKIDDGSYTDDPRLAKPIATDRGQP